VASPLPLDQTLTESTAPPQSRFDARHSPIITFVIIPKQMEKAVQRQHPQFGLERMTRGARLPPSHACRDHDVPETAGIAGRKRQHVGGSILLSIQAIQSPDTTIGDNGDHDGASSAGWRDRPQP